MIHNCRPRNYINNPKQYRYSTDFMLSISGFVFHKPLLPWQPLSNGDATRPNNDPLNYSDHYQCLPFNSEQL